MRQEGIFREVFQEIGQKNKQIKVIGLYFTSKKNLLNSNSEYVVSICTEHIDYACYDWRLYKKIRRDPRIHELEKKCGIPIIVDVISGIEEIPKSGNKVKKSDLIRFLYGDTPPHDNFNIIYEAENFFPSTSRS